jgi:hypothetical protein
MVWFMGFSLSCWRCLPCWNVCLQAAEPETFDTYKRVQEAKVCHLGYNPLRYAMLNGTPEWQLHDMSPCIQSWDSILVTRVGN